MAPPFESVHLPHLLGPADAVPPRVAKLADFYGDLARFASLTGSGPARRTPIACRRRPGRRPCGGLLVVRRRDLPPAVEWECTECGAQGQVSGWEGTDADLRRLTSEPDSSAPAIAVSVPAHAVLRDLARADASLIQLAYGAEVGDAGQPVLRVAAADALRYGGILLHSALKTSSRRRRGLLFGVADALGRAAVGHEPRPRSVEADPLPGPAFALALEALECAFEDVLGPGPGSATRARPQPRGPEPKPDPRPRTFRIKVTLRDVKPPVWRRLLVPSDISLPALHEVLQAALGWHDCHLHAFRARGRELAPPGDGFEPIGEDSRGVTLREIAPRKGSRVVYEYDFGDGWCHDILVEEVIDGRCASARCLKGRRSCPPEDCGGPWGYAGLREVLADPVHEQHEEMLECVGEDFDPDEFDVAWADALVQAVRV